MDLTSTVRGRFTLAEAAAIAGVSAKAAKHAFIEVLERSSTRLGIREILFLKVRENSILSSTAAAQRALYECLVRQRNLLAHGKVELEGESVQVTLSCGHLAREILRKVHVFRIGSRRVERRPDVLAGALIFTGTRIPVENVAALARRGIHRDELREQFPRLTDLDFEFAEMAARLGKPRGRPRKRLVVRRAPARRTTH